MFELKILTQFAAAHRLRDFKGKCEQLHGHNWKVEVFVQAAELDSAGLVRDFGEIKAVTHEVLNELDHHYLNELSPFQEENPSSEHIARYLFHQLSGRLNDERARVSKISVWESDTSCATYIGE
ncbi:MAG: 6-carboxytetrahydropterin synthase QueD [Desulfobacca sp.]|nr:6-carboxytetrahydropterin synthase QueD [Desulfobacca sp.]